MNEKKRVANLTSGDSLTGEMKLILTYFLR